MTENIMSYSFLKENYNITYSQYTELLNKAEEQCIDGKNLTSSVFESVLKEFCDEQGLTEEYALLEDEYMEAYDAIAGYDDNIDEISYTDTSMAAQSFAESANGENNYANSADYQNNVSGTPMALSSGTAPTIDAVSANDIMTQGKDADTLRQERADISQQIETQRTEMETAKATAQSSYDQAEGEYIDALNEAETKIANDQSEQAEAYRAAKEEKDNNTTQINDQKSVISDLTSAVETQKFTISALSQELSVLNNAEPKESDYKDEDGNVLPEFASVHEDWKTEVANLEAKKAAEEDRLSQYEQQLGEAENALKILEQESSILDSNLTTALLNLEKANSSYSDIRTKVEEKRSAMIEAQNTLSEITAEYEANIAQLQQNLAEYDTAISQAESNISLENESGIEKLGAYQNSELHAEAAENGGILSSDAETLSNEEQQKYLEEYLGDGNFGEIKKEGTNYFTKTNDDGTTDCFRVVNDNGEVKIIHTNIPGQGEPATEVFKVDSLSIDRMSLQEYGLDEGQNDSFAEYAALKGIDIETATVEELQTSVDEYNRLINQKNEFLELYDYLSENEAFKGLLDEKLLLNDSDDGGSDGKIEQSLSNLYQWVNDVGAFRTSGENGNCSYDDDFNERVADAISQIKDEIYNGNYNAEIVNAIKEIEAKYEDNIRPKTVTEDSRIEKYADIGSDDKQGDSFKEYLSLKGVDILSSTDADLETYLDEYNKLIEQKNEFLELYKKFEQNGVLSSFLQSKLNLADSDMLNGTVSQTIENLYEYVNNVGAFRTTGEDGTNAYDKDFAERVPDAIKQMAQYVLDNQELFDDAFVKEISEILS